MEIGHPKKFLALDGNRSSRPRVISPEVMSPETWVMFFFLFFFFYGGKFTSRTQLMKRIIV